MDTNSHKELNHSPNFDQDTALQALNEFLDGELGVDKQPALFAHLSECEICRRELEGVMLFRRLSRVEHLVAPPSMDAAMIAKLQKQKTIMTRIDRAEDRRPLWNVRRSVSVRATVLTVLLVFIMGLLYPSVKDSEMASSGYVTGSDELVEFTELDNSMWHTRTLYVFFPGLTVEASNEDEVLDSGQ